MVSLAELRIPRSTIANSARTEVKVSIIQCDNVVKEFHTARRRPGLLGTVRTLFTRQYDVKLLTGILVPTSGEIEVAGRVPWKARQQNALNIGVVFGQRSQLGGICH